MNIELPKSVLVKRQIKTMEKTYVENGTTYRIQVEIRFDDSCGNGHNTFSITGTISEKLPVNRWREYSGGCIHDDIIKHFPELAPFIKWHLVSTDGPMHYLANTMYHASNRDCWGKLKGEPAQYRTSIKFGSFPIVFSDKPEEFYKFLESSKDYNFDIIEIEHEKESSYNFKPKYTFNGYGAKWYQCPFDSKEEASQFLEALKFHNPVFIKTVSMVGEGKERDLNAARMSAVWPEATDDQLTAEPEVLKQMLVNRLPNLMKEFKSAIESLGFTY